MSTEGAHSKLLPVILRPQSGGMRGNYENKN